MPKNSVHKDREQCDQPLIQHSRDQYVQNEHPERNNNSERINSNKKKGAAVTKKNKEPKIFQCTRFTNCNMSFSRAEHLARHIRKHTGEKPYQCYICLKNFSRIDNLKQHRQTVHAKINLPPSFFYRKRQQELTVDGSNAIDNSDNSVETQTNSTRLDPEISSYYNNNTRTSNDIPNSDVYRESTAYPKRALPLPASYNHQVLNTRSIDRLDRQFHNANNHVNHLNQNVAGQFYPYPLPQFHNVSHGFYPQPFFSPSVPQEQPYASQNYAVNNNFSINGNDNTTNNHPYINSIMYNDGINYNSINNPNNNIQKHNMMFLNKKQINNNNNINTHYGESYGPYISLHNDNANSMNNRISMNGNNRAMNPNKLKFSGHHNHTRNNNSHTATTANYSSPQFNNSNTKFVNPLDTYYTISDGQSKTSVNNFDDNNVTNGINKRYAITALPVEIHQDTSVLLPKIDRQIDQQINNRYQIQKQFLNEFQSKQQSPRLFHDVINMERKLSNMNLQNNANTWHGNPNIAAENKKHTIPNLTNYLNTEDTTNNNPDTNQNDSNNNTIINAHDSESINKNSLPSIISGANAINNNHPSNTLVSAQSRSKIMAPSYDTNTIEIENVNDSKYVNNNNNANSNQNSAIEQSAGESLNGASLSEIQHLNKNKKNKPFPDSDLTAKNQETGSKKSFSSSRTLVNDASNSSSTTYKISDVVNDGILNSSSTSFFSSDNNPTVFSNNGNNDAPTSRNIMTTTTSSSTSSSRINNPLRRINSKGLTSTISRTSSTNNTSVNMTNMNEKRAKNSTLNMTNNTGSSLSGESDSNSSSKLRGTSIISSSSSYSYNNNSPSAAESDKVNVKSGVSDLNKFVADERDQIDNSKSNSEESDEISGNGSVADSPLRSKNSSNNSSRISSRSSNDSIDSNGSTGSNSNSNSNSNINSNKKASHLKATKPRRNNRRKNKQRLPTGDLNLNPSSNYTCDTSSIDNDDKKYKDTSSEVSSDSVSSPISSNDSTTSSTSSLNHSKSKRKLKKKKKMNKTKNRRKVDIPTNSIPSNDIMENKGSNKVEIYSNNVSTSINVSRIAESTNKQKKSRLSLDYIMSK